METLAIRLEDGRELRVAPGSTAAAALEGLGPLPEDVVAVAVDGTVCDLHTPLRQGGALTLVRLDSPRGLDVVRHSTAHVMAQAVARLFPGVEFAIGPVIEDGFYYDFDTDHVFAPDDLARIEAEMAKIVKADLPLTRVEAASKAEALATLRRTQKAKFKTEVVEGLPDDATVSFYSQGEFTDLCRGPHVRRTGQLRAFKLLSIAGAYWRGDERREQLQRIYGTAWPSAAALAGYLERRAEAERRDHRKLGTELDLYSIPRESPGMPLWHPRGTVLWNVLADHIRGKLRVRDYVEIRTPLILNASLWHRSGHMTHYRENMYFTQVDEAEFAVKPMNCPGSALYYGAGLHSYRELPLRIAEFGMCHRNEKSGVIGGLTRVREFVQDDAHLYCTPEQIEAEILGLVALVREVYAEFGFADVRMDFSTRPKDSGGTDEQWRGAEAAIAAALAKVAAPFQVAPGEGAFYGPKIDFHVRDAIGRTWQLATIQVDFQLAVKFDLEYVGADGARHRPVVLHRAILGSFERFIGILIEHFAGAFPTWLAPEQVLVIPVADDRHSAYATEVVAACRAAGLRASADLRPERMRAKIRDAQLRKIPYMLVVGDREAADRQVSVRRRDGVDCKAWALDAAVAALARESAARSLAFQLVPVGGA